MANANATKDCGPIRDDYAFFEQHFTEPEHGLAKSLPGFRDAVARRLLAVDAVYAPQPTLCRALDFGCGDSLNTFPHHTGRGRPVGPESDPHSILGFTKWLIDEVKGVRDPPASR